VQLPTVDWLALAYHAESFRCFISRNKHVLQDRSGKFLIYQNLSAEKNTSNNLADILIKLDVKNKTFNNATGCG